MDKDIHPTQPAQVGVTTDIVSVGKNASAMSAYTDWTEPQRQQVTICLRQCFLSCMLSEPVKQTLNTAIGWCGRRRHWRMMCVTPSGAATL